jgi:GGDEF domain-containing protein
MAELPDDLTKELLCLFGPRLQVPPGRALEQVVRTLVTAEQARQGRKDPVSGAYGSLALLHGALLKPEYDLSTHGHWEGWPIGAVIVDIERLILVNQAHGFPAGDAVLRAVADTLAEGFPTGKVVRLHGDAFVVLLPPSAEREVTAESEDGVRRLLEQGVPSRLREAKVAELPLAYTVALLRLCIEQPSHWQVLGPLVWAESERTLVLAKTGAASGVQHRRIPLSGSVPLGTREPR